MRAFDGQLSEKKPIPRSLDKKRQILTTLRDDLAALKPHSAPALRESIVRRISELEADVAGANKKSA